MEVSGHTMQLGIIGYPVEHSFSPKMHNFMSDKLNNDYIYSAWCVEPQELRTAIEGIKALGIKGVNVTAPHKVAVMEYLDEISPQAKFLGSVNTVVNRNGKLYGYNTDSEGFYMALKSEGIEIYNAKILVLGAGGVVKPTLMRLVRENPKSITLATRTKEKAKVIAEAIKNEMCYEIKTEINILDFDIVINTTSAGMAPQLDVLPIDAIEGINDLEFINEHTAVIDMIYNPNETRFLKEAKIRGAKTMNGLNMLIYQGLIAYELFTGTKLPDDMAKTVRREVFGQ